jgi:uncharacterized membrane protein
VDLEMTAGTDAAFARAPRDLVAIPYADTLARFGQRCFGVALLLFGAAGMAVHDVVVGRAPAWPAGVAGAPLGAYLAGIVLGGAGVAVLLRTRAVRWLVAVAALIAGWALLRQLPFALADHQLGGAWTNLGKALALSGGALGVAASMIWTSRDASASALRRAPTLNLVGRCALGAFLVLGGTQHFLFTQFVATLVPSWIPGAIFWTYFAATALIAGGIGLVVPRTSRLAAASVGAMIFTWLLVLHIPRGITMNNQNEWTAVIEALAMSAIAFSLIARPASTPVA